MATNHRRVTIKQVATEAGVSIQTVSRVLNDLPHVAPETRQRVLEVIDRLQYRPSTLARSLIHQRSAMLGVVTAGLSYIGPSRTLNGIAAEVDRLGYELLLHELPTFSSAATGPILNAMLARQVDGIIWAVPEVAGNRQWLLERWPAIQVPVVFLTMHPAAGLPVVSVDNYRGGRLATSHLVEQGYRRIGHVAGPLSWWEAEQRLAAWRDVLSEAGLPVHGDMWVEGNWSSRSGELAAQQLLAQCPDLEAVFVANDQMALSLAHVAARQGRTIPGDLAVVGFDNLPESAYFHPPLTTVHQDLHRLGCRAVETVVGLIEAESTLDRLPATSQAILIEPELIVRQSTLAPPS